jgi:diguanylate cyclase (GGDEF)-like protein
VSTPSPALLAELQALLDHGQVDQALPRIEQALAAAAGDPRQRAALWLLQATAYNVAGRHLQSLRAAVAAREAYRADAPHTVTATATASASADAHPDAAASALGECDALLKLGQALRGAGDHASALAAFEEAEALARQWSCAARQALASRSIGVCCSIVGRHQQALSQLQEAQQLQASLRAQGPGRLPAGEWMNTRLSWLNARSRQTRARPAGPARQAEAQTLIDDWQDFVDEAERDGQHRLALMGRGNRAIMQREVGHSQAAIDALNTLLGEYLQRGMRPNAALSHVELGHAHRSLNEQAQAATHYRTAIGLLREQGSLDDLGEALEGLSWSEEALDRPAQALAALREWREVEQRKSAEAARAAAHQRELRIELARLTSQWAQQATQDPLTGLGNRRALERWMAEHLPRVEQGSPLSLLLIDLDHFKQVNDHHGHGVGDLVLQRMAQRLRERCRHADLAVRYGGEEFLLATADIGADDALRVAERLCADVAASSWHDLSPGLAVTVSIGVAHASEAAAAPDLLTLADKRLYAAKYAGRNRVVAG